MTRPILIAGYALLGCLCSLGADPGQPVPTAKEMETYLANRPEQDVIRWKDESREPLQVRILRTTPKEVVLQKTVNQRTLERTISWSELESVSIVRTDVEESLLRSADPAAIPALRVLWESRSSLIASEGMAVGEIGLALAKALRREGAADGFEEAAQILDLIRTKDANVDRQAQARAESQTLELARSIATGNPEETDRLAWDVTESQGNPDGMLLATSWLADRHLEMLKELEGKHPRWDEDDEVKPMRQRLYNLALDFALYPSLFHGNRSLEASQGLLGAWKVYQYTGEGKLALNVLDDLIALYPDSDAAGQVTAERDKLRKRVEAGQPILEEPEKKEEPDATQDGEETDPEVPPKPKRYNLFDD